MEQVTSVVGSSLPSPALDASNMAPTCNPHLRLLLPATPQCAVCKSAEGLSHCGSCKVESYCCREHQKSDWSRHKATCNALKQNRATLDREEQVLRKSKSDPFHNNAGRFWKIPTAQPYLQARLALVDTLRKQQSRVAVEAALFHSRQMLDLARVDRIRVRELMPDMYLRLGRDQECYDFIKWWYLADQDCRNDFEPTTPYLTLKGEDVFEPIVFHLAERQVTAPDWSHMVALTLLKIRALLDLKCLHAIAIAPPFNQIADDLGATSLTDKLINFYRSKSVSSIIANSSNLHERITDTKGLAKTIQILQKQVAELYVMVVKEKEHLWCKFLNPVDTKGNNLLELDPVLMGCESCSEAAVVLQNNYRSWYETPGAVELIRERALQDVGSCTYMEHHGLDTNDGAHF